MEKLTAYPLFVKDPFFSFWSSSKDLNDDQVKFWVGFDRDITGYVEANGNSYRFMGKEGGIQLKQVSVRLTSFTTEYSFEGDSFDLKVRFFSPLNPEKLDVIALPVCYLSYEITPKTQLNDLKVIFKLGQSVCYDASSFTKEGERAFMRGGVIPLKNCKASWMGLRRQQLLSQAADAFTCDWGYWYVAGAEASYTPATDCNNAYITATCSDLKGDFIIAFDDIAAIYYFGDVLKSYYFDGGKTIINAIEEGFDRLPELLKDAQDFDKKLMKKAEAYGEDYSLILKASLRQSVGAHKLCKDREGNLLFLSKECRSNGCIGTVDVSYPSIPLYLMYNPALVKGMMVPIIKFARMDIWNFDFAPHDVGCYPYCCGQVYGLDNKSGNDLGYTEGGVNGLETYYPLWQFPKMDGVLDFNMQMPVEECGNMLIMAAAYAKYVKGNDKAFLKDNYDLFVKWVDYLDRLGYCPDNQLCTDDFAGHLDKNVNLSIKASVGMRAFAEISKILGEEENAKIYTEKAITHAQKLEKELPCPMPLAFDSLDTFSLKYNIAFDVILGFNMYSEKLKEAETSSYIEKSNKFGVPLDSRKDYTKSDWIAWTTVLTKDIEKRKKLLGPVATYLRESPTDCPFGDWYETKDGSYVIFRNRTVQGGMFITLLVD